MTAERIFEEPSISRQWVLRRLQRALTTDLAAASFQRGISKTCRRDRRAIVAALAASGESRADRLRTLITSEGSVPYQSIGMARLGARFGGGLIGIVGAWAWAPLLRRLTEHMLQEYDLLVAFARDAPGVSADLATHAEPLLESARSDFTAIRG
jgi:hypothetical protein